MNHAPGSSRETLGPLRLHERAADAFRWLRENLFYSWLSALVSIVVSYVAIRGAFAFIDWAVINSVWTADGDGSEACRAVEGKGACWAVIAEKYRFILFGTYPYEEHWRPASVVGIFITLYALSASRRLAPAWLAAIWIIALATIIVLLSGDVFGLTHVPQDMWGGLVVTLLLATVGLAVAFPFAIAVALGRRSNLPAIRILCVAYVELVRGVPLISLLFMASVMLPLFLPDGVSLDKLLRAQVAFILFAAAYLAEVVRGGLQAVPKGQYEASYALGMTYWQTTFMVVLPQALRIVIPPLVNTFIGFFKDTSLVLIIGIFDLLSAAKTAVIEPAWQGFGIEVYLFCGIIYFLFCFAMSRYSRQLEARLQMDRP